MHRYLLYHYPIFSLLILTSTSLFTTLSIALLAFYYFSPPSSSSSLVSSQSKRAQLTSPTTTTAFTRVDATTLDLSRAREKEWAASLPRAMGSITGERDDDEDASTSVTSEEEAGERLGTRRRLTKEDREEAVVAAVEERELERLRAREDALMRAEEDRRLRREEAEEEMEREGSSEGSETTALGGSAVRIQKEEWEGEDDGGSLLGGVSCTSAPSPPPFPFFSLTVRSLTWPVSSYYLFPLFLCLISSSPCSQSSTFYIQSGTTQSTRSGFGGGRGDGTSSSHSSRSSIRSGYR